MVFSEACSAQRRGQSRSLCCGLFCFFSSAASDMEHLLPVSPECDRYWKHIAFPTSQQRHFIFPYIWIYTPPKQASSRAPGAPEYAGLCRFHTGGPHQSPSSFSSQRGVLLHWWERLIDLCYLNESHSIKRPLHLGHHEQDLSEACHNRIGAAIHLFGARREWKLVTASPPSPPLLDSSWSATAGRQLA